MNKIIDRILYEEPDAIFVFDVDGVLSSYEYGDYHHGYSSYTWNKMTSDDNPYLVARPFKTMQKFVKEHVDNCYICSCVANAKEAEHKMNFLNRHYGIDENHMFFVPHKDDKLQVLYELQDRYPYLMQHHIVMIEDTVETLDHIMEQSNFSTVHVSSFFD